MLFRAAAPRTPLTAQPVRCLRLAPPLSQRLYSTAPASRPHVPLVHHVFHPSQTTDATANRSSQIPPIVFMHGLFGSKQNNRSISKALANRLNTSIYTVDLRNHGDSPHHAEHTYAAMADDLEMFIDEHNLESPVLMGHSMGAKVSMVAALRQPSRISSVIAVDNSPVRAASLGSDFATYVAAMQQVDAARVTRQRDADAILQSYHSDRGTAMPLPIRQFLLTNLVRNSSDGVARFRVPLATLSRALDGMAGFPWTPADGGGTVRFDGPALFIRGTKSSYVKDEHFPTIRHFFPHARVVDVDAGHWLIAEQPEVFGNAVVEFLESNTAPASGAGN